jgi:hypothetical protein
MTFLNPVAEQLTGWSYAEAQGLPFSDAFKLVDETTHAPIENLVECCLRDDQFVKLTQQPALLGRHGVTVQPPSPARPPGNKNQ